MALTVRHTGATLENLNAEGDYVVTNPAELPAGTYYVEIRKGKPASGVGFVIQRCTLINNTNITRIQDTSDVDATIAELAALDAVKLERSGSVSAAAIAAWVDDVTLRQATAAEILAAGGGMREVLTANRTYYVRTDGSDLNTGLTDDAAGAFLTLQKACNVVTTTLDAREFDVTIEVRAGSYAGCSVWPHFGTGTFRIRGDETTPANVTVSGTSNRAFWIRSNVRQLIISGFRFLASATRAVDVAGTSIVQVTNCSFEGAVGATTLAVVASRRCSITITGTITFEAGYGTMFSLDGAHLSTFGSTISFGVGCTCTQYTYMTNLATSLQANTTLVGTLTGKRAVVASNSILSLQGAGEATLPGDVAATTSTGGQIT